MFHPLTIPYGAKMLFNAVRLKPGVTIEQIELALGELCNTVKNTYGTETGGFLGGQVYSVSGFVSEEGSISAHRAPDYDVAIVTYWRSFEQHETSHADALFREKFAALMAYCDDAYEIGLDMLWQGAPAT